jgi:hypothetical protein
MESARRQERSLPQIAYCRVVSYAAGLELMGRGFAKPPQGKHLSPYRHRRERSGAIYVYDELAVHPSLSVSAALYVPGTLYV